MVRGYDGDFFDDEPAESELLKALIYREIDHHGPDAEAAHAMRTRLTPALTVILEELHGCRALTAGQQMTIPLGLSCGFEGELVLRVTHQGPDHRAAQDTFDG